jgi:hypothetical protein
MNPLRPNTELRILMLMTSLITLKIRLKCLWRRWRRAPTISLLVVKSIVTLLPASSMVNEKKRRGIAIVRIKLGYVPHCRFLFPKHPYPFGVDAKTGDITLEQNQAWVNKRNKILSCAFRSNHDISFIASTSRMLASLYYMSNYATKGDVKLHQFVMTTVILKASLEKSCGGRGRPHS